MDIGRAGDRRAGLISAALLMGLVMTLAGPGEAADPSSGTIDPQDRTFTWQGSIVTDADQVLLTVDVPSDFWDGRAGGVSIAIEWDSPVHDLDLSVLTGEEGGVGARDVASSQGNATTWEKVFIDDASTPQFPYRIVVSTSTTPTAYRGVATLDWRDEVVFDGSRELTFAPATVASAHFLGSEPMLSMERPLPGSLPGALDPDRIYVDWPLTKNPAIGQLSRSIDGGDSFRLLFDPLCAQRSRPNCQSEGGGDTFNQVSRLDGTVYFSDQEGAASAHSIASSTDHGDTWPILRQHSVSNATTAVDRQWIATTDTEEIKVGGVHTVAALLSYSFSRIVVQGIDSEGIPVAQPIQVLNNVERMGPIRVDATQGPGRGWVYQPYHLERSTSSKFNTIGQSGDVHVATVLGENYQIPTEWRTNLVRQIHVPQNFTWLDLDARGNAYAVWEQEGKIFYSASPIDDPLNNPKLDPPGRPGSYWTPIQQVSLPELGSVVFAEVTAGDEGRIAITYDGTTDITGSPNCGPDRDDVPPCPQLAGARWRTYAAVIENALAINGPPVVTTGFVSHRVVHTGNICTEGSAGCMEANGQDRSLLDMIDIDHDVDGRIGVVFTDNNSTFAESNGQDKPKEDPFSHFAMQLTGPTLSANKPEIDLSVPLNERVDLSGDATWPNQAGAGQLPSLDALGASLFLEGEELVARVPLTAGDAAQMTADLAAYNAAPTSQLDPAERLQYVVRFMTADDIYHLSMESTANGNRRFFGGRLDDNDALTNGSDTFGGGYHTDASHTVTGEVDDDTLVMRGRASDFGLGQDSELFSVTAFTMAGPSEQNETSITNPMRTIDATPPFDAVLTQAPAPGLDCTPESGEPAVGTIHPITCVVRDVNAAPVEGLSVSVEASGANDADGADTPTTPDLKCLTDAFGACTISYPIDEEGTTTFRAWIDADGNDATVEADLVEGRDELAVPGSIEEPDGTDVIEATAARLPALVELSPAETTAQPGSSQTVTATVTDATGAPVEGAEVEWSAAGQGRLQDSTTTTDGQGQATAIVTSNEHGNLTVRASTSKCADDGDCLGTTIVHWGPEFCDVFGTDGKDLIEGTEAGEVICGFGGSDVIRGGGGDDILLGGRGSDVARGGGGNDILRGGRGNDRLLGVGGTDILKGGGGGDELRGGRGPDRLRGGRGHDDLFGGRGRDLLRGGRGADALRGGPGADRLRGGPGRDACHTGSRDRSRGC